MTVDRITMLERRLASAERDVRLTRRRLAGLAGTVLSAGAAAGLMAMTAGPQPLTVKAPFLVVDQAGQPILEVKEAGATRGVRILNVKGENVADMVSISDVGFVRARRGEEIALLGTTEHGNQALFLMTDGKTRAELAIGAKGNPGLRIYGPSGAKVAVVALNPDGTGGQVQIADVQGSGKANLAVSDAGGELSLWGRAADALVQVGTNKGVGSVRVYNHQGQSVALMEQSSSGAGYLGIMDPSGHATVEAGFNGTGVVRAIGPGGKIDYLRGPSN